MLPAGCRSSLQSANWNLQKYPVLPADCRNSPAFPKGRRNPTTVLSEHSHYSPTSPKRKTHRFSPAVSVQTNPDSQSNSAATAVQHRKYPMPTTCFRNNPAAAIWKRHRSPSDRQCPAGIHSDQRLRCIPSRTACCHRRCPAVRKCSSGTARPEIVLPKWRSPPPPPHLLQMPAAAGWSQPSCPPVKS